MPRSIALWITLREVSRSVRWPKLLQPMPTADTRRPEPPRLRISMGQSCGIGERVRHCDGRAAGRQGAALPPITHGNASRKKRSRSDAATDGDRSGREIRDGGPDLTQGESLAGLCNAPVTSLCNPQAANARSEQLAIDDEAGLVGDLVVKLHCGVVGLVCLPVDARRSGQPGLRVDAVDQRRGRRPCRARPGW